MQKTTDARGPEGGAPSGREHAAQRFFDEFYSDRELVQFIEKTED